MLRQTCDHHRRRQGQKPAEAHVCQCRQHDHTCQISSLPNSLQLCSKLSVAAPRRIACSGLESDTRCTMALISADTSVIFVCLLPTHFAKPVWEKMYNICACMYTSKAHLGSELSFAAAAALRKAF